MTGHYIAWTIDQFGVKATVTCREDADAPCRFGCHKCDGPWTRCEELHIARHADELPEPHCTNGHRLRPYDECTVVAWFDNATAYELYDGSEDHPISDGLIEIVWDYDGMTWHYPDPDPAQLAVTP